MTGIQPYEHVCRKWPLRIGKGSQIDFAVDGSPWSGKYVGTRTIFAVFFPLTLMSSLISLEREQRENEASLNSINNWWSGGIYLLFSFTFPFWPRPPMLTQNENALRHLKELNQHLMQITATIAASYKSHHVCGEWLWPKGYTLQVSFSLGAFKEKPFTRWE